MSYIKTTLNNIQVGDVIDIAAEDSNGHDFKFVNAVVTQIVHTQSLFKKDCLELVFGTRRERFEKDCPYLFNVKALNSLGT
jgi:hypothetical protein